MATKPLEELDAIAEVELEPRRQPIQARAKRTVEIILDTTAALIERVGIDRLNTNLIAERAGLPIRTVYRYFPNKISIVYALGLRFDQEWEALGDEEYFDALADPAVPLWEAHEVWANLFLAHLRSHPGSAAFRRAIGASPQLMDLNLQWTRKLARRFASALRRRGVEQSDRQLELIGLTLYLSGASLVDFAVSGSSTFREPLFIELQRQQRSYLEAALPSEAGESASA